MGKRGQNHLKVAPKATLTTSPPAHSYVIMVNSRAPPKNILRTPEGRRKLLLQPYKGRKKGVFRDSRRFLRQKALKGSFRGKKGLRSQLSPWTCLFPIHGICRCLSQNANLICLRNIFGDVKKFRVSWSMCPYV